jgi:hypothetical protein
MRRITTTFALFSLAAVSCGKSEAKLRKEVTDCSAITLDAAGISGCLVARFKWDPAKAAPAGAARQRELDSTAAFRRDSVWKADAKAHRKELAGCAAAGGGDLARCLENAHGWDEQRAVSTADSLWRQDAPRHRTQIQACQRQRKSSVGSCLILYYKWTPKRAFALADSVERAKMKAYKNR